MRRLSPKREKQNREYLKLKREFLAANPLCLARISGCLVTASQVHHKKGRIGALLTDVSHFLPVCGNCHRWIETHALEAKKLGLSLDRLTR